MRSLAPYAPAAEPARVSLAPSDRGPGAPLVLYRPERPRWNVPLPDLSASPLPSETPGGLASSSSASDLCVLVPDRQEVRDLVAELAGPQRSTTLAGLRRSGRYLPLVRAVLAEEGLPEELAYLAFVESHFLPDARSASGAIGLWQFIDTTGRNYGLRIDEWVDERLDPEAATRAAVRHLGDLRDRFGDWNLAIAAYNAGPGGVGRALDRYRAESFWDLYGIGGLRHETCRYVVKFLAAVTIASDPTLHGLDVGALDPPLAYDTVWVNGPADLSALAAAAGLSPQELKDLNPSLLRGSTPPGGGYPVRVPRGSGPSATTAFRGALEAPPREELRRHKTVRGDTLTSIARRYGVEPTAIAALNGIAPSETLRVGRELLVKGAAPPPAAPPALKGGGPRTDKGADVHVVRRGETMWGIARRYGVSPGDLLRWNRRVARGPLRPGDQLVVAASEREPR